MFYFSIQFIFPLHWRFHQVWCLSSYSDSDHEERMTNAFLPAGCIDKRPLMILTFDILSLKCRSQAHSIFWSCNMLFLTWDRRSQAHSTFMNPNSQCEPIHIVIVHSYLTRVTRLNIEIHPTNSQYICPEPSCLNRTQRFNLFRQILAVSKC